jgi:light-regulated signal transduction histidine kinase (bacteriophytochrome)
MENQNETLHKAMNTYKKEYSEFIETASHDLDTPLRKLSYLVEKVTSKYKKDPEEDVQSYVKRIETCLADMRSLVDSLARLSSIISDPREYVSCNLETIVREVTQESEYLIKEKNADITFSSLPVIEADRLQCKQLFKNLFENAIRFSKKEVPPTIRVSSEPLPDEERRFLGLQEDKKYFKINITDNGIGFKQENAEKIFRAFVRLNGKYEFPGNGLGLAICKKIIENHQGVIYAEGRENEGARFILILPESH